MDIARYPHMSEAARSLYVAPGAVASPVLPVEGQVLGGTYRILRRLDEGGMGTVFEAEHLRLHRRVAVKVVAAGHAANPELLARFEQEAEIVSRIQHPHVVTVLDFDVSELGEPYLVLELLRGENLATRLERESPLPLEQAVAISGQVAAGLSAAHRGGVVHRDLKPGNVFLIAAEEDAEEDAEEEEAPFVKLLDFGISKRLGSTRHLTQVRQLIGTPDYMAPEQAAGRLELVGPHTDQYALAVVAYEMLTGIQPFSGHDLAETLRRVTELTAAPASSVAAWLPEEVSAVLARGMSKEPSARFPTVVDFAIALAQAAQVAPGLGRGAPLSERVRSHAVSERPARASTLPAASSLAPWFARARVALDAGAFADAASHVEAALECADTTNDPATLEEVRREESLIATVLINLLGGAQGQLYPAKVTSSHDLPLSPRTVFLLSRLAPGMTVEEALDVASMPRTETLRRLAQLARCGAV